MLVTTKIISFDDASEEIEQSFHQTVKKWLDTIWDIMEPRLAEEDVKLGLKQLLDSFVTPNSPVELVDAISWNWQISRMEKIGSGTAGRLVIYVADATLKLKENEGVTRVSITTPKGKTLHVETEIVV